MHYDKSYEKKLKKQIIFAWILTICIALIVIALFILDFIFWNNIIIKIIGGIGTILTAISAIIAFKKLVSKEDR